jgi:vacuolar protein sorting-associated protein 54
VLETLVLLLDYLKITANPSVFTMDAVRRIIEFLKVFNSRTCWVVHGAHAMRSVSFRLATAKRLSAFDPSAQNSVPTNIPPIPCLLAVIPLVLYVREMFRRYLSPNKQSH